MVYGWSLKLRPPGASVSIQATIDGKGKVGNWIMSIHRLVKAVARFHLLDCFFGVSRQIVPYKAMKLHFDTDS